MRYGAEHSMESDFEEATTGFIDIQFGLIAILILALSIATAGILNIAQRLELTESGAAVFAHLLLYEPGDEKHDQRGLECGAKSLFLANVFGDSGLGLCAEWSDGVVVLGPGKSAGTDLFKTTSDKLPEVEGSASLEIIDRLRVRTNAFFPCFAPLDRSMQLGEEDKAVFNEIVTKCHEIYLKESGRRLASIGAEIVAASEQPGLDLFIIEGHADGQRPKTNDFETAAVADSRAQRILYGLLVGRDEAQTDIDFVRYVNKPSNTQLPYYIDRIAEDLPEKGRGEYRSGLLDLVPLSTRIFQECMVEYRRSSADRRSTSWCGSLLQDAGALASVGPTEISSGASGSRYAVRDDFQLRVPRIFAVSSYGRFSLRYGQLGVANDRDRRVEFRFRPAAIPLAIHKLVRDEGDVSYYRLYSAAAAVALHRCDLERDAEERDADATCVGVLERLVRGDDVPRNVTKGEAQL